MSPGPRRLTRYLFAELQPPTLLGLSLYSFVLLMNAFFLVARVAIAKSLGWDVVSKLFLCEVPPIMILTIPMGVLLGTMIGIGRLSSDSETLAIQGAGLGPSTLIRPVIAHGLLASTFAFVIYAVVVPHSNFAGRVLNGKIMAETATLTTTMTPRVFYTEIPGFVIFVDEIRPGTHGKLDGVLIEQSDPQGGPDLLFLAKTGDLYRAPDGSGKLQIDLRQGVCHVFRSLSPGNYRISNFDRYQIPVEPPSYLRVLAAPPDRSVQDMSLPELFRELSLAPSEKEPVLREFRLRSARIEAHQRFALPLASLLFALLGLPLGMTSARSGKGAGFAMSLAVFLVYYEVFLWTRGMATQGRFPVVPGVWAANGVTAAWTALAFHRLRPSAREGGWLARLSFAARSIVRRLLRPSPPSERTASAAGSPPAPGSREEIAQSWPASSSQRFVGLVDRLVSLQFLRVLVLALASAYGILTVIELKDLLDGAAQHNQPYSLVFRYLEYFAPGKAGIVVPVACLVAGVVAFTLLSRSGELTAMKAAGISMRRASAPVFLLTLGICVAMFLVQDQIAPVTTRKAQEVRDQLMGKPPRTYGLSVGGRWAFGPSGHLYHYGLYDPDRMVFQRISAFSLDRSAPRIREHLFASSARWKNGHWELDRGWYRAFPPDGSVVYRQFDTENHSDLDPPENFARREVSLTVGGDLPDQMDLGDLGRQISSLRDSGYDTTRLEVAYYSKLAYPATPMVMVLLGLPFAFSIGRRGSLYGIGVALLLVIVYWATFAIFNALGLETILPPFLAAWAPNILYGLVGASLMLYIRT